MFRRFLAGASDGDWPVATLGSAVRGAIGAKSRTVRLSAPTAAKQARRHPELRSEDYAHAQRILDEGELFDLGRRRAAGFLEVDGRLWRAILKATDDRTETYLVSLHMAQPHNRIAAERGHKVIDQAGN